MNLELIKAIGPYVGGLLAIAGVFLNFGLNRWAVADAQGKEHWRGLGQFTVITLLSAIAIVALFSKLYLLWLICLSFSGLIQIASFFFSTKVMSRLDVGIFVVLCCSYIALFSLCFTAYVSSKLLSQIAQIVDNDKHIVKTQEGIISDEAEQTTNQKLILDRLTNLSAKSR